MRNPPKKFTLTKNTFLFMLYIFLSINSDVMSFRSLTLSSSASELSMVVSSYASSPRVLPSWARLMAIPRDWYKIIRYFYISYNSIY